MNGVSSSSAAPAMSGVSSAASSSSSSSSAASSAGLLEQVTRALDVLFHGSDPHQQMQANAFLLSVMNTHESAPLHTSLSALCNLLRPLRSAPPRLCSSSPLLCALLRQCVVCVAISVGCLCVLSCGVVPRGAVVQRADAVQQVPQ